MNRMSTLNIDMRIKERMKQNDVVSRRILWWSYSYKYQVKLSEFQLVPRDIWGHIKRWSWHGVRNLALLCLIFIYFSINNVVTVLSRTTNKKPFPSFFPSRIAYRDIVDSQINRIKWKHMIIKHQADAREKNIARKNVPRKCCEVNKKHQMNIAKHVLVKCTCSRDVKFESDTSMDVEMFWFWFIIRLITSPSQSFALKFVIEWNWSEYFSDWKYNQSVCSHFSLLQNNSYDLASLFMFAQCW